MHVTAGDFRIDTEELDHVDEIAIVGGESGNVVVCGVWPMGDDAAGKMEQMANARLLCASKKLLSLVRRVAESFPSDSRLGKDANELIAEIEGR